MAYGISCSSPPLPKLDYLFIIDGQNVCALDWNTIPPDTLDEVEADTFWCMSKLLDGIQDHYTFAQPGIQRKLLRLSDLMGRVDSM